MTTVATRKRSSVVERGAHNASVTGSIPVAFTNSNGCEDNQPAQKTALCSALRFSFRYCLTSGSLVHRRKPETTPENKGFNTRLAGKPAFISISSNGYRYGKFEGVSQRLHRLIWIYHNGSIGPFLIDHIDRDRMNNRIENLRPGTWSQNQFNSTARSGLYKGVSLRKNGTWAARAQFGGRTHNLGTFETEVEAAQAYDAFTLPIHGDFAVPNLSGQPIPGWRETSQQDSLLELPGTAASACAGLFSEAV